MSTPLVCMRRWTSTSGSQALRSDCAVWRRWSTPTRRGSPPWRTMSTRSRPWARACSAMRSATRSTVTLAIRRGWERQLWSAISYM